MGTSIDYSTVSHETIYRDITSGPGSAQMVDASQVWNNVATKLLEIQKLVDKAVGGIAAAQQGAAADAATHATITLMPWVTETATTAMGMAARVSEQAAVFSHTRDSMPPPRAVPDVSFRQDPGTWVADQALEWLPGIQTEHEQAQVAAQQDEQRARDLMTSYQGTSNEILASRQQFTAAPEVVAEVAPPAPGGAHGGPSTPLRPASPAAAHPTVAHPAAARSTTPHLTVAHPDAGADERSTADTPAATTSQLAPGFDHAPAAVSPQLAGDYPSLGATPIAEPGSVQPATAAPFGPSPMLTGSAPTGQDLRGGSRRRSGSFGPRPSAPFSTGASHLSGSPGQNRPLHSGLERSGLERSGLDNTSFGHGGVEQAGAGRPGYGGAGFVEAPLGATGGSGRGDDTVRQRPSYLLEQDTNAIVGELPPLAPPVIGADEDYQ